VITESEITDTDRARYFSLFKTQLSEADRNHDGRITREEFSRVGEVPFYSDIHTVAGLLLIVAFAGFCMFLDGLLDAERREYLWYLLAGVPALVGLAYLCAPEWFLTKSPYFGFVVAAPVTLIVLALVTGATRAKEAAPAAPKGTVVYKVGEKPAAAGASGQRPAPGGPPRRPVATPPRPRPAPTPPRLPPRPSQSSPGSSPPRPPGGPPKPGGPK
jgi:hypothetical protein